jgi:hypothetical protein
MPNISLEATLDSAPQASAVEEEGSVRLSESCRSFVGHDRQFMADNTHQMAGSDRSCCVVSVERSCLNDAGGS